MFKKSKVKNDWLNQTNKQRALQIVFKTGSGICDNGNKQKHTKI